MDFHSCRFLYDHCKMGPEPPLGGIGFSSDSFWELEEEFDLRRILPGDFLSNTTRSKLLLAVEQTHGFSDAVHVVLWNNEIKFCGNSQFPQCRETQTLRGLVVCLVAYCIGFRCYFPQNTYVKEKSVKTTKHITRNEEGYACETLQNQVLILLRSLSLLQN